MNEYDFAVHARLRGNFLQDRDYFHCYFDSGDEYQEVSLCIYCPVCVAYMRKMFSGYTGRNRYYRGIYCEVFKDYSIERDEVA